jgi:DMSO/TMAO reductase YedYZ molybdopterin-dependent catalytic subunit
MIQRGNPMKNKTTLTIIILMVIGVFLIAPAIISTATAEWNLQITDLAGNTSALSYDTLLSMPRTTVTADLYCYGFLLTGGDWTGIKLSDFLDQTQIDPTLGSIQFLAQDGYTITIPIEMAMRSDVIIAYEKDNAPLLETLRLVIPEANGNLWISMITSMNMSSLHPTENLSVNYVKTIVPQIQPSQQQQTQPQQTPPSKNETVIAPIVPTTNVTQPNVEQKEQVQQNSGSQDSGFPVEVNYVVAFVVVAVVAAVGLMTVRHKRVLKVALIHQSF